MSTQTVRSRVIAIDPGYDRCGVAVLEKKGGKDVLLFSACLTSNARQTFFERLGSIGKEVAVLIKTYGPGALAIENLFFNTNQKTAMHVAEVRGAIIYLAGASNIPVYEYTPAQIKVAVSGSGRADKKQVIKMIPMLVRVEKTIKHDDEYDAIALGITHLNSSRSR